MIKKVLSKIYNLKNTIQINHYLRKTEEEYPLIQKRFLARQLRRAQKNVPFYQRLLKGQKISVDNCMSVLSTLPVMSKADIASVYHDMMASYVGPKWKHWFNTGGSTGEPFHFPICGNSIFDLNGERFCQAKLYTLMGGDYNCLISSFDGVRLCDTDIANHIYWKHRPNNFPYGKTAYSALCLNEQTFPYYLANLNKEKPTFLRGYPSAIYGLTRLMQLTNSKLSFDVKAIYLTSENILDYQIKLIQEVFNCPVWGQYGHSEASIFAIRRPNERAYYCSPIYGMTEVLDRDGNQVGIGEIGEVVVTGFQYSAMPFIRYRTGDIAEYGGVNNGIVKLNSLLGRDNDYILKKDNSKVYLAGLIFGAHPKAFNHIASWQIVQNNPGELILNIVKRASFTEQSETELKALFKDFSLQFNYVSEIEKTKRGKQPFLIQTVSK